MKMFILTSLICVLLTLTTGVLAQTGDFFDCNRPNQTCYLGTCDPSTGNCKCEGGLVSTTEAHCLPSADDCNATIECSGHGKCRPESSTNKCYCNQDYHGAKCEVPRMSVFCTMTTMTISVIPFNFSGLIYAVGRSQTLDCHLNKTALDSGNYSISLQINNSLPVCGLTGPSDITNDEGIKVGSSFDLRVHVQYTTIPNILVASDQELHAQCQILKNQSVSGTIANVNATGKLNQGGAVGSTSPLVFKILKVDASAGAELTPASVITVQDNLDVTILLLSNSVFTKFRVDSCQASNRLADTGDGAYDSFYFVRDGCPSQNLVVRGNLTMKAVSSGQELHIPIKAFMFLKGAVSSTNQLYVNCSVILCPATDLVNCVPKCPISTDSNSPASSTTTTTTTPAPIATPTPDTTPTPTPVAATPIPDSPSSRRRRDADLVVNEIQTRTLGQSLTVHSGIVGDTEVSGDIKAQASPAECLQTPEMQTVVAALGLIILALLIAFIIVLVLYCRGRSRKDVDDLSSASSTQNLNMHIPRPRLQQKGHS